MSGGGHADEHDGRPVGGPGGSVDLLVMKLLVNKFRSWMSFSEAGLSLAWSGWLTFLVFVVGRY